MKLSRKLEAGTKYCQLQGDTEMQVNMIVL